MEKHFDREGKQAPKHAAWCSRGERPMDPSRVWTGTSQRFPDEDHCTSQKPRSSRGCVLDGNCRSSEYTFCFIREPAFTSPCDVLPSRIHDLQHKSPRVVHVGILPFGIRYLGRQGNLEKELFIGLLPAIRFHNTIMYRFHKVLWYQMIQILLH